MTVPTLGRGHLNINCLSTYILHTIMYGYLFGGLASLPGISRRRARGKPVTRRARSRHHTAHHGTPGRCARSLAWGQAVHALARWPVADGSGPAVDPVGTGDGRGRRDGASLGVR